MADTYYPFDGAPVNEAEWSKFARLFLGDGVVPFPASVGAGYNTPLSVFADSTGLQVKTRAGVCAVQGFYFERGTDNTVIAIGSNSSGSTRIDRIVAKLDRANNLISIVAKQGTGSPPSLQQDATIWEMSLAQVSVANGAATLAAATVTDERRFAHRIGDAPYGLVAAPKFAITDGSLTGASVVKDSGVGDIVFTADPNAYYRITYSCMVEGDTAGQTASFSVRDGGTSSPTSGSTLVANRWVNLSSSTIEENFILSDVVGPGLNDSLTAGVHTFGVFYNNSPAASGGINPVGTASAPRSFTVEHIGYVI